MGLYFESNIHSQPTTDSARGVAQGRISSMRANHMPARALRRSGSGVVNSRARMLARTRVKSWAMAVKRKELNSAARKAGEAHTFPKLRRPT